MAGIKALEKELLAQNAEFKEWECTEKIMKSARDGKALYMHCLPADITGVNSPRRRSRHLGLRSLPGSADAQAGYKPYIIAAMILLARFDDLAAKLFHRLQEGRMRVW